MKRLQRFDVGALARPVRTPEGFLRVDGVIAKCGPLEYTNADGSRRIELVLPEVLFEAESVKSFAVLALTNTHPPNLLSPHTVKEHMIGTVGEPRRDGDGLASLLGVLTADAIATVEAGTAELSCGYSCELDETPGDHPQYGRYDAIQRARRGNHVAIVPQGRAGASARIRLDAAGNACLLVAPQQEPVLPLGAPQQSTPETAPMPLKLKIGKHHLDASDANASIVQDAIDSALAESASRADAAESAKKAADAARADSDAKRAGLLVSVGKLIKGWRARLDAMKARQMACDECSGTGKVPAEDGADGAMVKCDYCDGKGSLRMHDSIKAAGAPGEGPTPDDDLDELEEDMDDLSRESPTEEKVEVAANALRELPPKRADARKRRADERKVARQKRADSILRAGERAAKARAALLLAAGAKLGADVKLDGKGEGEIQRLVVAKLAPHVKLDGLGADAVALLYRSEMARADAGAAAAADAQPSASDLARAAALAVPASGGAQRKDSADEIVRKAAAQKANAWQRPAAK